MYDSRINKLFIEAFKSQLNIYQFKYIELVINYMVIISITPEIALDKSINYAGGLGVLEGDKFYAAGDMGLDYLVLSLYYRGGYTKIKFHGSTVVMDRESANEEFYRSLKPGEEFTITLNNNIVYIQPWIYEYKTAKAVLFEAKCPEWARKLTDRVYIEDSDFEKNMKYVLLAKASWEYMNKYVGLENISLVDLEESYTGLILYLMNNTLKARIIIHTPGPWGHPLFPGDIIEREFGVKSESIVNMTRESIKKLSEVIVVSKKQSDIIPRIFPEVAGKLKAITNGIYLERWMDSKLYNAWLKREFNLETLKETRLEAKRELESLLRVYKPGVEVGNKIVITWSRRLSRYKRPYFIARFLEENPDLNAIVVLAGKPHPKDPDGYKYLYWFRDLSLKLRNVVYIPDYNLEVAKILVKASDLWLFTPFSGWEACGTSYMKALVNGVPVLSSRDGGVLEVVTDGVNGWLFGEDIRDFVNIYEDPRAKEIDEREYTEFKAKLASIIDMYYNKPEKYWEIALNAWRITPDLVDIKKVLRKYYFE